MVRTPPPAHQGFRLWYSHRELALVVVALATFATCVLATPWEKLSADGRRVEFAGYAPIFRPPEVPKRYVPLRGYSVIPPLDNYRIARSRLVVQLALWSVVGAGVAVALRR